MFSSIARPARGPLWTCESGCLHGSEKVMFGALLCKLNTGMNGTSNTPTTAACISALSAAERTTIAAKEEVAESSVVGWDQSEEVDSVKQAYRCGGQRCPIPAPSFRVLLAPRRGRPCRQSGMTSFRRCFQRGRRRPAWWGSTANRGLRLGLERRRGEMTLAAASLRRRVSQPARVDSCWVLPLIGSRPSDSWNVRMSARFRWPGSVRRWGGLGSAALCVRVP
ncbi:hypothetical protein QFZ35_000081 [Arthrobacter ulcerisalmonis]|nr:hypothetical protein [Arthrobacter ulcerisalmonis]MDQ0729494.1 hypothetical protein [Arthrobacter sp. B1I2]